MTTRQIIILVGGIAIIFGSLSFSRFLASKKAPPEKTEERAQIKLVESIDVKNGAIQTSIPVYGRITATEKLQIFSEVTGALVETSKPIKKGTRFSKGSLLVAVDDREIKLNIQSQKANLQNAMVQMLPDLKLDYPESYPQWQAYIDGFDVNKSIESFPEPVNDREKYYVASRNIYSQYYTIKSQETRIDKYRIYAPFSGVVTETSIFPGTVIRAAQPLATLMNTNSYELEATIGLADLKNVKAGDKVILSSEAIKGEWTGTIKRISQSIDPGTQSALLYIGVRGSGLKENMYLRGAIKSQNLDGVYELPRKLVLENDQVYIIQDSVLALMPLNVIRRTGETVIVKDLPEGTKILKDPFIGAFPGFKVQLLETQSGESQKVSEAISTGN